MWPDSKIVLWKEMTALRRTYRKPSSYLSTVLYVVFFGVFPAYFLQEDFAITPLTLFYLSLAPLVIGAGIATLTFAGERENHTIETLLATRLSNRSILFGKIISNTLYAWMYIPMCLVAGWITATLSTQTLLRYDLAIVFGSLLTGLLIALLSTNVGVLASLRAATVKEAGRKIQGIYLLFAIPYFVLNLMPKLSRNNLLTALSQVNVWLILLGVSSILLILNLGCIFIAVRRFRRQLLIWD